LIVSRPYQVVDFGIELDEFAIKDSSYVAGEDIFDRSGTATTAQSTTIMSNYKMEGYMGVALIGLLRTKVVDILMA